MTGAKPGSALLFISHAAADGELVSRVAAFVSADRPNQVYASSQPGLGTGAGERWEEDIYTRLRRSAAVLFVLTPASLASQWCFAELAMAKASGIPILTLRAVGDVPAHPLTRDLQSLDLTDQSAWSALDAWLRRYVPEVAGTWPEGRNPFPGAAAFTANMEAVFVGREDDVIDILQVFAPLRSESGSRRIVVVSGPSGSGKSSFVQAGIIPRLARRPGWKVLPTVRTGEDPFGGLALSLVAASLHKGVAAAMPNVPFLCHIRRSAWLATSGPYPELVKWCHTHHGLASRTFETLAYFDLAVLARDARCPAHFGVALRDETCPPSGVYACFNHYGGPKEILAYEWNGHEGGGAYHLAQQDKWITANLTGR